MKKALFTILFSLGLLCHITAQQLNTTAESLNKHIKGNWILTNTSDATDINFNEFKIKGPGFGEIIKQNGTNKPDALVCKIVMSNGTISITNSDGDRMIFKVLELTPSTLKLFNGKNQFTFMQVK